MPAKTKAEALERQKISLNLSYRNSYRLPSSVCTPNANNQYPHSNVYTNFTDEIMFEI